MYCFLIIMGMVILLIPFKHVSPKKMMNKFYFWTLVPSISAMVLFQVPRELLSKHWSTKVLLSTITISLIVLVTCSIFMNITGRWGFSYSTKRTLASIRKLIKSCFKNIRN